MSLRLNYCRLAGTVALIAVTACACLAGPAGARPAAAHHTIRCTLAHGLEGGGTLAYFATNVSCQRTKQVVVNGRIQTHCNEVSVAGCTVDGFVCRDSDPQIPSFVSPGDIIRCTQGRKAVKFEEPG
jgi:hypothetical protein